MVFMDSFKIVNPPKSRYIKSCRVILKQGESVGEHITEKREEIIVVIKGKAELILNGKTVILNSGDVQYIGEGVIHNIINNSENILEYVYVVCLFDKEFEKY